MPGGAENTIRTLMSGCARFSFDRSYLYSVCVEQCLSKIL